MTPPFPITLGPDCARALVSARRLRDLKAAPEDGEIEAIEPVERTARALQTVEWLPVSGEQAT